MNWISLRHYDFDFSRKSQYARTGPLGIEIPKPIFFRVTKRETIARVQGPIELDIIAAS